MNTLSNHNGHSVEVINTRLVAKDLVLLVFSYLMLEKTFFEIFLILFPVVFTVFIRSILTEVRLDILELVAKYYVFTYVIFMLFFGRDFSLELDEIDMVDYGPFSGDTRIIHASSILMIIIPYLWFLNKYLGD